MIMDRTYNAFHDELEKIAVSVGLSHFPQSRRGKRSVRATTLLKNEPKYVHPEDESLRDRGPEKQPEPSQVEVESGRGFQEGGLG